jgi:hypothetical protein
MLGEARFGRYVAELRQIADPRAFSRDTRWAKPAAVAQLLVGACLHRAFLTRFNGDDPTERDLIQFAADVVDELGPTLEPDQQDTPGA